MSNNDLAIRFFLQLAFIVATCRIVGLLAKRVGQPQVVAEMIAGVLMGPSLFGLLLPGHLRGEPGRIGSLHVSYRP